VHATTNVARAFETMHDRDIVIGDVNSNNVVIHRTSKTRFIDCDSVQIRRDGRLFRCNVGVPDYQPPELQSVDLTTAERLPEHDRFGLAVMIFQLLFVGKHPFAGVVPAGVAADATLGGNIAARRFFYAPDAARAGLRPPPGSLALSALPEAIAALFMRAFLGAPADRPTAAAWREALRALESTTAPCERSRRHRYVRDVACPWCELERSGLFYFAPHADDPVLADDSAWERFPDAEVERVWQRIAAIRPAPAGPDPVGAPERTPLRHAVRAAAAAAARLAGDARTRAIVADRRARLAAARATYQTNHARWRALASHEPFLAERARLEALRDALLGQRAAREAEIALARRAQYQLDAATFLAQFPIPRVPQVPGSLVTPSGPTTGLENRQHRELARYGITNASHVTVDALRAVPHLRSWRFDVLMEWRMALDARFAALPVRDLEPRVRRTIDLRYTQARDEAAATFTAGVAALRDLAGALDRERAELEARLPGDAAAFRRARAAAAVAPFDPPAN
jgi:hypothetical protein